MTKAPNLGLGKYDICRVVMLPFRLSFIHSFILLDTHRRAPRPHRSVRDVCLSYWTSGAAAPTIECCRRANDVSGGDIRVTIVVIVVHNPGGRRICRRWSSLTIHPCSHTQVGTNDHTHPSSQTTPQLSFAKGRALRTGGPDLGDYRSQSVATTRGLMRGPL